ncbi:MAG: GNAT family N-acetyltransferase [Chloroflexia bacterium]|nr:GNAT family N-acetyltransferase [Chloroflexia bacterium]
MHPCTLRLISARRSPVPRRGRSRVSIAIRGAVGWSQRKRAHAGSGCGPQARETAKDGRLAGDRQNPDFGQEIRRARPDEAAVLSELALRSKGHWGYDAAFLAACRDDLTLSADDIASSPVYVVDGPAGLAGFYRLLLREDGVAELDALFVEPAAMGRGVGHRLWQHAVAHAAALGCAEIVLQSDPQAVGFYEAMGAHRAGESASTVTPGRMLPVMRYSTGLQTSRHAPRIERANRSDSTVPRPRGARMAR